MLQLLAPALFTAALAGLLLPLILHFWDRGQGRRVLVGSLRWLEQVEKRRLRRIRFSDIWGFLLRSLILLLFALLLGRLVWQSASNKVAGSSRWVLLAPPLADLPLPDSLLRPETPLRLLAPGFPALEEGALGQGHSDYWTLLRELATRPDAPDSVLLIAPLYLQNFQGARPALPFHLSWLAPPEAEEPTRMPLGAWQKKDQVQLLIAETEAQATRFEWKTFPAAAGPLTIPGLPGPATLSSNEDKWLLYLPQDTLELMPAPSLDLLLVYDNSLAAESRNLSAALQAAATYTAWSVAVSSITLQQFNPEALGKRQLIWLSAQAPPEKALLIYRPESTAAGDFLIKKDSLYLLRRSIDTRSLLESGDELPRALIREWLNPAAALSFSGDRRLLPETQAYPEYTASAEGLQEVANTASIPMHQALWLLLAALFFAERLRGSPKGSN